MLVTAFLAVSVGAATLMAAAPTSIIHVVTLYWKDGTTDAQKQEALEGVKKMSTKVKGLKNVWIKSIKVQGSIDDKQVQSAFVMEFESAAAFKAYDADPAHKAWEEIYLKVRGESRTFDITN